VCAVRESTITAIPMAAPIWRTGGCWRRSPRRALFGMSERRRSRAGAGEAQTEAEEGEARQQGGEGDVRRQHDGIAHSRAASSASQ